MKSTSSEEYNTYHNHRADPYFTFVKNSKKTIEGRLKKDKYALIAPGDHIVVHNQEETDSVEVVVKGVRSYESFEELLKEEPLKKVLPDANSVEHGVKIYRQFYSPEQERRHGVVAIEVALIK